MTASTTSNEVQVIEKSFIDCVLEYLQIVFGDRLRGFDENIRAESLDMAADRITIHCNPKHPDDGNRALVVLELLDVVVHLHLLEDEAVHLRVQDRNGRSNWIFGYYVHDYSV